MEVKIIGQMDNTIDHTFESANRGYDKNQLCPTIPTCAGGNIQPKIIEETKCIVGLSDDKWGNQYHQQDRVYKGDIAQCIPANLPEGSYKYVLEKKIQKVGQISNEGSQCGTVVSEEGLAPTLSAGCHGYANPHVCVTCKLDKMPDGKLTSLDNAKICDVGTETASTITARYYKGIGAHKDNMCIEIKQATKDGSIKCKIGGCYDGSFPDSKTRRGRVQNDGDVVPTLTASNSESINYVETQYRIRKLTPRECWRLMGYTDEDFDAAQNAGVSNSQLYKQAGNAIVKQVLMAIFSQLNIRQEKV